MCSFRAKGEYVSYLIYLEKIISIHLKSRQLFVTFTSALTVVLQAYDVKNNLQQIK